jgi:hypothetical protein
MAVGIENAVLNENDNNSKYILNGILNALSISSK